MGLMKPIWKRKLRRVGDELIVSIPAELKPSFETVSEVIMTVEGGKLVISIEDCKGGKND
jgi:hypothetical protein